METKILSTNRKALQLNLDPKTYGTIAEIGGGQEVARHFFQAGAASGTVAKTISAYDKLYSDALYEGNPAKRYVSERRLTKMLKIEFDEVTSILSGKRDPKTLYFAFANTVTTLNYTEDNYCHGWLGVRFQLKADSVPNEVVIHVKLLDSDHIQQQQALGVLGINLIYACFYHHKTPNIFLQSLLDNISRKRIEVSMARMSGPDLSYVDNRLLCLQLVKNEMTPATIFDRSGSVNEPSDMLYQKNVLAFRGSFRPITYVGFDMLRSSFSLFKKDEDYSKESTFSLCEMTLKNLLHEGNLDEQDFLDRIDILNGMGQNVMISNFREYYKLVEYFSQFKTKNLRVVIGIPTFLNVLDKKYYNHLKGGILEAFGKLFPHKMKLYVYPTLDPESGELITSKNLPLPDDLKHLYQYLISNRKILDLTTVKKDWLHIKSMDVLSMIENNEVGWEKLVPVYIEEFIKTRKPFHYKGSDKLINRSESLENPCL